MTVMLALFISTPARAVPAPVRLDTVIGSTVWDCPTAFLTCEDTCTLDAGELTCAFDTTHPSEPLRVEITASGALRIGAEVGLQGTRCCLVANPASVSHIDLSGSAGPDTIEIALPQGTGIALDVHGREGNDVIDFQDCDTSAVMFAEGNTDDDAIVLPTCPGGTSNATASGGQGNDTLFVHGTTTADADDGDDEIFCYEPGDCNVRGSAGNDTIYTTSRGYGDDGSDTVTCIDDVDGCSLYGGRDDDVLYGSMADDRLHGGNGADTMWGGAGDDFMEGNTQDDVMYGEEGDDEMYGDFGNDVLDGGPGYNTMEGGEDDDILYGGNDPDGIDILIGDCADGSCDAGNDELNGFKGENFLYGDCALTPCTGGTGTDKLFGGDVVDWMYGETGDDRLYGYTGNDVLEGGDGADVLYGQSGVDSLVGGEGDDLLCERDPEGDLMKGEGGYDTLWYGPAAVAPNMTSDAYGGECGDSGVWFNFLGTCYYTLFTIPPLCNL